MVKYENKLEIVTRQTGNTTRMEKDKFNSGAFNGLSALTLLSMNRNRLLKRLVVNVFQGLDQFDSIDISYCNISVVETGAFQGLTALTYLDLSRNQLQQLTINIFSGLQNCVELKLHGNSMSEIESGTFSHLNNVQRLVLGANQVTTLRASMFSRDF